MTHEEVYQEMAKERKIFEALRSGSGYVRIVAPRYDNSDFDIKIPAFREQAE